MEKMTLKMVVQLLCFVYGCDEYQIRGIVDTSEKISACYVAEKACKMPQWKIAKYFQIDLRYMCNKLEDMAIALLVSPEDQKEVDDLVDLIKNLSQIKTNRV